VLTAEALGEYEKALKTYQSLLPRTGKGD